MPTLCYAVAYERNGGFIVATKNTRSYYYTSRSIYPHPTGGWQVLPAGQDLTRKGGGLGCFPGGGLLENNPFLTARLEFLEETGADIMTFNSTAPPVDRMWDAGNDWFYHGVYFQISGADLITLCNQASAALTNSAAVAALVRNGTITSPVNVRPEAERNGFTPYAYDNELLSVAVMNCTSAATIAQINAWNGINQDWFVDIFNHLRTLCQH